MKWKWNCYWDKCWYCGCEWVTVFYSMWVSHFIQLIQMFKYWKESFNSSVCISNPNLMQQSKTLETSFILTYYNPHVFINYTLSLIFFFHLLPPLSITPPVYSVHPFMPLVATSSGQRQFPWPGDSEGDSASDGEGGEAVISPQEIKQDNALSLWWAGPLSPAAEGGQEPNTLAVEAWSSPNSARSYKLSYTCHVMFILGNVGRG